jgi:hypothetical protein
MFRFLAVLMVMGTVTALPVDTTAQSSQSNTIRPFVRSGPVRVAPVQLAPTRAMPQFRPRVAPQAIPQVTPQLMPQFIPRFAPGFTSGPYQLPVPVFSPQPAPYFAPVRTTPPLLWTADARVIFGRAAINWHHDEASFVTSRTWGEFGVNVVAPIGWRLGYSVTTSIGGSDEVVPLNSLVVGATNFAQGGGGNGAGRTSSSSQQNKPVSIDYTILPSHRFELACLSLRNELHPVIMAEYTGVSVTGVSTTTGQQKRDSETFRSWFWGVGAEAIIPMASARGAATIAAGDKYLFVDMSYFQRVGGSVALGAGWQHKTFRGERGNTLRVGGPYLGAEVVF